MVGHDVTRDSAIPLATGSRYSGASKACIIAHKERGARSLTAPLGVLLAMAITTLELGPAPGEHLVLVGIPPHRSSLQQRGADTVELIARQAARTLGASGQPTIVRGGLRRQTDHGRHVGRSARDRRTAILGSFAATADRGMRLREARIVIVDDVITTGATAFEAVRALTTAGLQISGIAAVADTPLHQKSR